MKKFQKSTLTLMLVIVVAKFIGMFRDIVLANYFGTSNVSDAYLVAALVPTSVFYFIGNSISTAYIPMYSKVKEEKGEKVAQSFSNNLLNIGLVVSTLIVVFLVFCPMVAVRLFATGFDEETASIAADLIKISSPSIYFMTIVSVFTGYLQANKSFIVPAAVSVPRNIAIVMSIVVAAWYGINYLGIGLLVAYVFEFLFLLPFTLKKNYHYNLSVNLKDPNLKYTVYIILPILFGVCVNQINRVIDKSIASTIVEGGISALSYASIINNAVQEILVTGIITVLFASCAELVARGKYNEVKAKLSSTLNALCFLLIPASVGVICLARPIVKVILCRGSFDDTSIAMTSGALCCYTVGLCFLAIRDTLVKVFYAYKDTKTTTITSTAAIVLKIAISFLCADKWGINGLAIATSISAMFNSVILYVLLRKKIGDFGLKSFVSVTIKSLVSSGVMAFVIAYSEDFISSFVANEVFYLIISVSMGAIVYFMIGIALKTEPIIMALKKVIKR